MTFMSPDSREMFACFLKTVERLAYDIHTAIVRVSRNFRIVNSPKFRSDMFATLARTSYDCHQTIARQSSDIFWRKIRIKVINVF